SRYESDYLSKILAAGGDFETRYMETNQHEHLLHHNKFIVFEENGEAFVFGGAGNFTNQAFKSNFENYYAIFIPEVVREYQKQYRHLWEDLATPYKDLPVKNVKPIKP